MSVVDLPLARPVDPAMAPEPPEAATVLEAVARRVLARAVRRAEWLERSSSTSARSAASSHPVALLSQPDVARAEHRFYSEDPSVRELSGEIQRCEALLQSERHDPLAVLCHAFELAEAERDVIEVCLARAIEPAVAEAFAKIDARGVTTEALVAALFGRRLPVLSPAGALRSWQLLQKPSELEDADELRLDPFILDYLAGARGCDPQLVARTSRIEERPPLPDWPVHSLVRRLAEIGKTNAVRIAIVGPPGSGRRTFAACVAREMGLHAVQVEASKTDDEAMVRLCAHRQAILFGHAVVWTGDGAGAGGNLTPGVATVQFVVGDHDVELTPIEGVVDERVTLPALGVDQRRQLWRRLLPETAAWTETAAAHLAERFRVQVGDIARVASTRATDVESVHEHCRELSRHRLGDLGVLLPCPFERADLLLPEQLNRTLDEFLFEAAARTRFWEEPSAKRLFPRGRGLVGLMTGPPGTGKTMAAQVVARELGLDLIRIDVAASVSKYIGETAKNLRRLFARAREMNAVLLFDEADALFSKRTDVKDAHDRYANTDTNYLLQLLEDYQGIALLASNKKNNIDAAFVRRIRFVLDFPRPGPEQRQQIWRRLVRELLSPEDEKRLAANLDGLAKTLELSGAQIKLSLLAGVFLAKQSGGPLAFGHLYRGIDRELMKEGRNLTPKDRERLVRAGVRL